jgi:ribosomal protein S18 acetylase RimI-like enzyme
MTYDREIRIRDCDPGRDLDGLCRTFSGAFHHTFWPVIDEAEPELIRHMMRGLLAFSPQSLVATEGDGSIVGFILGYTGFDLQGMMRGAAVFLNWIFSGLLLNRFRASPMARRFILDVAHHMGPIMLRGLRHDTNPACEVNVFAVDPASQGRGIGKRLMDEFVREAKTAGARQVVLLTDTTLSWQFYPSYGFHEARRFEVPRAYVRSLPDEADQTVAMVFALEINR